MAVNLLLAYLWVLGLDTSASDQIDIRLVNGPHRCSGRVEVFHNGQWGTVCDDDWGMEEARVVCKQLGCGEAKSAPNAAHFGRGDDPIWLDDLRCNGTESALRDCPARHWGKSDCRHAEDAGVVCSASSSLRLAGVSVPCSGRVEVLHNQTWGTVCDNGWDLADAHVVCQEVGCGEALAAPGGAKFGQGLGPTWMDQVNCTGEEDSLSKCPAAQLLGENSCDHSADAGVECAVLAMDTLASGQLDIRLVNGPHRCSGRIEVFHNGQWGTICDDDWDMEEARVVCQELGCGEAISAPGAAYFGRGDDPIWLDDLRCNGTESALRDCPARHWGKSDCSHAEDAGVVCIASLRLADGLTPCSGRVEVLHNKQWGTVCNNGWDLADAHVVCQEVGCGKALATPGGAKFGEGSGPTWMDQVNCTGEEDSLKKCSTAKPLGENSCDHSADAGVECAELLEIRLSGGPNRCSGRVEIFHEDLWGTVHDDGWDIDDANVVCWSLGCGTASAVARASSFGEGSGPVWLDEVDCVGSESTISKCKAKTLGNHSFDHSKDAGVVCTEFRLVNGPSPCSGRVEAFHYREWGTVCDSDWDIRDTQVLCRELDCGNAIRASGGARFGQGSGPIWLDKVNCKGQEARVSECPKGPWGVHSCDHSKDASVECSGPANIRLVNGSSHCNGRVEVFHNGLWGTVCDDDWDINDATVVCREVGCGIARSALAEAHFGSGDGPIWLDNVGCKGTESALSQCSSRSWGESKCFHREDAGVVCSELRLADGPTPCSGRVEIVHNEQWGTVCDNGWDLADARVTCKEVGCGRALAAPGGAKFGHGSGPSWMDQLNCTGQEDSLSKCPAAKPWGENSCDHSSDAGVECADLIELRLVDGLHRCSGRVEVLHRRQFGTVCDDGWDLREATVVCRHLDCGTAISAPGGAYFGRGSDPIWLDDLNCTGAETSLFACQSSPWGSSNCYHGEDASVICSDNLRLINGSNRCSGRVEFRPPKSEQWGTVCDRTWDMEDAEVVCRQLNCGIAISAPRGAHFGKGSNSILLDDVHCTGTEQNIAQCRANMEGKNSCHHGQDAGIVCSGKSATRPEQ